MLLALLRLLLGIALRGADQCRADRLTVGARVYACYYQGEWSPGYTTKAGTLTLPSIGGTLATVEFGLTPTVVEISLTGKLECTEAEYIIGGDIWEDTDEGPRMTRLAKTHLEYERPTRTYKFKNPSIFMDMEILARAMTMLLPKAVSVDRIIPGPLRLLDNKPGSMCIMLSKIGTPTFKDKCAELGLDYKAVARRFPKDAWNVPLGERRKVRLKVVAPAGDGSHDGNFFLKPEVAYKSLCLYRGMGMYGKKAFLVKGRGIATTIDGDYDGVITTDNIKWNKVKVGSVIEVDLIPTTDETNHTKDEYGWHSMSMLFMDQTIQQARRMREAFIGHVTRLSDRFCWETTPLGFSSKIKNMCEADDDFAVVNSDLAKHVLGLASVEERESVWRAYFSRVVTMKTKTSRYPAIIFATEWQGKPVEPGLPLYNKAVGDWLQEEGLVGSQATMVRYPVASKGSYLSVTLLECNQVDLANGDPLIIAHPRCAAHLQGDGDDHVLLTYDWLTTFHPSNEPIQPRKYEPIEPSSVLESLLQVWQASKGIGLIFNSMAKSVGAMHHLGKTHTEIATEMQWFGGQLDLYAQAVKKPYLLTKTSEISNRAKSWVELAMEKEGEKHPLFSLGMLVGCNVHKEDGITELAEAVEMFYGVSLPDVPEATKPNVRMMRMADPNMVMKHVSLAKKVRNMWEAVTWHKDLVAELLDGFTWESIIDKPGYLGEALDTYGDIAMCMRNSGSEEWPVCLKVMNGNWLAATQLPAGGLLA